MFPSSFPIGRLFGVELRIHASLPPLLALALIYSEGATGGIVRGLGLCAALLFAIVVREIARAIAAAWNGLHLRALLIFPVGGIMAFVSTHEVLPESTQLITVVTPLANIAVGLLLTGLSYGISAGVHLFTEPWISAHFILRSFVWIQFALGAVSLVPLASFSSRHLTLPGIKREGAAVRLGLPFVVIAFAVVLALIFRESLADVLWLSFLAGFLFFTARSRPTQLFDQPGAAGSVLVRDAMQTDFALLSSTDTLRSALGKHVGSVQEVFPVVRGDRLVGVVSRDTLAAQLRSEGDGYIQGLMSRNLPFAAPSESLGAALRRSPGGSELIAVADGPMLLGILTSGGVRRAMQQASLLKLAAEQD